MTGQRRAPSQCPLGPVMRDVPGLELSSLDEERLLHPNVGGVVLFAENYHSSEQLAALVKAIHALREPALLVCVDQEGGRVQRFRDGFVRIPAMREFGQRYAASPDQARQLVTSAAHVLGSELLAHGVDISFTPVLDLSLIENRAIGDRALHADPDLVSQAASVFIDALRALGLPAIGKHFPGHGAVEADSHVELPIDSRTLATLHGLDMIPYRDLIESGRLDGVMTAHIMYADIDPSPPTFSEFWIKAQLRTTLGFKGVVFSDDLHMQGAVDVHQGAGERGQAALTAGCDVLLMCRDAQAADDMCDYPLRVSSDSAVRIQALTQFCRTDRERRVARVNQERSMPSWNEHTRRLAEMVA